MNTPGRPHLTVEQIKATRQEITILREQPGKEQEALDLIHPTREDAMLLGLHEDVVDLYWEEYLVGKHLNDTNLMESSANSANDYIDEFNVESKRPRNHRFLGEVAMRKGNYDDAIRHFNTGIELFEQMSNTDERVNSLEFKGFLAEALVRSGKVQEGIALGAKTFEDFDKEDGAKLKERDYYTWAVWKSGIISKVGKAVLDTNTELDESEETELLNELEEAGRILSAPRQENWPSGSEYRKDEITRIKQRLISRQ